ncbi:MAG: DNA-binding protein Alba [Methanosphaera stadtmanae]|nr:DNA-binding protein Alba [Methanosphaera stadtmanae]
MYIGNKSVMNYVFTLVNIFNEESDVVSIQARGRVINKAVDVVEVLRHRFITDLTIEDISISTQQIIRDDGRESNVSAINITIRN